MITFFVAHFLPARWQPWQNEIERLARFAWIGGLSFLIAAGLYAFFSRVIWTGGNHTTQNFFSTVLASIFNYFAHRAWTFRSSGKHLDQIWRYLVVAVSATLLQAGLFWFGHAFLGWYDLIVIVLVAAIIPLYTYFFHRVFTFKP